MFCTSRTSCAPRRTSSKGLYAAERASTGLKPRQCEKRERKPAVRCQCSPLMSCTNTECGQDKSDGTTRPTPLPDRVGANTITRSNDTRVGKDHDSKCRSRGCPYIYKQKTKQYATHK